MNKKMMTAVSSALVGAMLLTGCSTQNTQSTTAATTAAETAAETTAAAEIAVETTAATEETTAAETTEEGSVGLVNPWTESDEQGTAEATGFDMTAPEGAGDVAYSYMAEGALAQMTYALDGGSWTYRIQAADELQDISGMSYTWSEEAETTVSGRNAVFYAYTSGDESVRVMNWYDAVTGVTYSLSCTGQELSAEEMQKSAEALYAPLQGEAEGDDGEDTAALLDEYFLGEHTRSYDESTLTITENEDGSFGVNLSVTRLCTLEDGVGSFENHTITFTATDPSGNELTAMIYLDSDNSLAVKILESTWELLPADEILDGFGR